MLRERSKYKCTHHKPCLHVCDAGAIGTPIVDRERTAFWFSTWKDRVAMPKQNQRLVPPSGTG